MGFLVKPAVRGVSQFPELIGLLMLYYGGAAGVQDSWLRVSRY
jgi:hypothetical protein